MASFAPLKSKIFDREERKQQYQDHIRGLNAYDRHKKFLNDYVAFYGKEKSRHVTLPVKTDQDTLREGYRFIRSEEDDKDSTWEQRLVKRYYDKLFKEYCIADMSHYKSGKIGLRWRTEKEVISGKGQFICGNKHCDEKDGLASYEVNFSYAEAGESKQALVKLVTCERCAEKLHYKRCKEKEQLERREKELYRKKSLLSGINQEVSMIQMKNMRRAKRGEVQNGQRRKCIEGRGIDHGVTMIEMRSVRGETLQKEEENKSTKGKGMKLAVAMDQMMCMAKVKRKEKEKRFQVQPMIMMLITETTLMNFSRACSPDSSRMTLPCPLNPGGKLNSSSISMLHDYPVDIVEILLLPATRQQ